MLLQALADPRVRLSLRCHQHKIRRSEYRRVCGPGSLTLGSWYSIRSSSHRVNEPKPGVAHCVSQGRGGATGRRQHAHILPTERQLPSDKGSDAAAAHHHDRSQGRLAHQLLLPLPGSKKRRHREKAGPRRTGELFQSRRCGLTYAFYHPPRAIYVSKIAHDARAGRWWSDRRSSNLPLAPEAEESYGSRSLFRGREKF